jgi:glycolate oxidase FAD binding subunit
VIRFEPTSVEECAEVLGRAARERLRLTFVGGGTSLELGNPGQDVQASVLTRKLCRVVEYAPEDQVIVAEAGVTLAELQSLAARNGQWLGVDAPHAEQATLGGLVAVNAFGPRRLRYGGVRELLLGVTLVRADGVVAKSGGKVVKNVAGFDVPKLVCGSLGTLGLIAQVTFRLHPLPEATETSRLEGSSPSEVIQVVHTLRRAQLEPSSVVALWTSAGRFELGVRFEGFEPGVRRDSARLAGLIREGGSACQALQAPLAIAFWQRHDLVRSEGPLRIRVNALPTELVEVEAQLAALLAGLEQPRFAWYPSLGLGFASGRPVTAHTLRALAQARAGIVRTGGSLVVLAAPPEIRQSFDAWGTPPSAFAIMQELKQRFDPERRLNPGRFVGGL